MAPCLPGTWVPNSCSRVCLIGGARQAAEPVCRPRCLYVFYHLRRVTSLWRSHPCLAAPLAGLALAMYGLAALLYISCT